jgi:peptidoglycan biosynthesis protein MviN/MurJ (putative lipid II flippase)
LLYVALARRRWLIVDRDLWRRLPRIVTAVALMGLALVAVKALLTANLDLTGSSIARIVSLVVLVATGLAVYLVGLQLFGVAKLKELIAAIRHGL